jgi:hypothetical protein
MLVRARLQLAGEIGKSRDNFVDARNKLQGGDTTALDQEINQLNSQITQLETQLAGVNTSLTLTGLN